MDENARLRAADALAKAVLAVKRINETQMRTADYHGEGCRCWRCKEDAMFAALDAYETAALTPAPEAPKGGEGENSGWAFDRYINGILMAEGVEVTRPMSFEKASILAAKLASRGPNGEVPVLVLRATPAPGADSKAGLLRAGKRYRDGNGEVKGPLHSIHWENGEEMLTDSYVVWHPDGTLAGGTREDKRSLVAEVE